MSKTSNPKVSHLQIEEVYSALSKLDKNGRKAILDRLFAAELPDTVWMPSTEFDLLVKRVRDAYDFIPKLIERAIRIGAIPHALLAKQRLRLDELTMFRMQHTRQPDAERERVFCEILRAVEAGEVTEQEAYKRYKDDLARYKSEKIFLATFRKWKKKRESEAT